jgi:hypothetical protein
MRLPALAALATVLLASLSGKYDAARPPHVCVSAAWPTLITVQCAQDAKHKDRPALPPRVERIRAPCRVRVGPSLCVALWGAMVALIKFQDSRAIY